VTALVVALFIAVALRPVVDVLVRRRVPPALAATISGGSYRRTGGQANGPGDNIASSRSGTCRAWPRWPAAPRRHQLEAG
jgi:hypothetical protein